MSRMWEVYARDVTRLSDMHHRGRRAAIARHRDFRLAAPVNALITRRVDWDCIYAQHTYNSSQAACT